MIHSRVVKEFDPTERLYCCIAVAVLGTGAIGAGAMIYGANTAANAQTQAANAAIQNQQQMYATNQTILNPFIQGGASQIPAQQQLLSGQTGPLAALTALTTPGPNQNAVLQQTPGYQFSLDQGLRASNNQLAARGLGGSGGAVAKGAANYAEGLAGTTWQSVVQALQNQYTSQTGAGQALINSGEGAGGALAGVGTNTANSITGSITGAGNANAAAANATGGAVSNAASSLPSSLLLSQLLQNSNGGGLFGNGGNSGAFVGNSSVGGAPLAGQYGITPQNG